jgi:hypothetical protein
LNRTHALPDQVALQLSDGGNDCEKCLTRLGAWGFRLDASLPVAVLALITSQINIRLDDAQGFLTSSTTLSLIAAFTLWCSLGLPQTLSERESALHFATM